MSTLNQLLSDLDATQESIGRASRAMLSIQNEEDAVPIAVREWSAELRAGDSDQALPFIYLANDVLQVRVRARIQCLHSCSAVLRPFVLVRGGSLAQHAFRSVASPIHHSVL